MKLTGLFLALGIMAIGMPQQGRELNVLYFDSNDLLNNQATHDTQKSPDRYAYDLQQILFKERNITTQIDYLYFYFNPTTGEGEPILLPMLLLNPQKQPDGMTRYLWPDALVIRAIKFE